MSPHDDQEPIKKYEICRSDHSCLVNENTNPLIYHIINNPTSVTGQNLNYYSQVYIASDINTVVLIFIQPLF